MGIGKHIEQRGHVVGFREEITRAASEDDDNFFGWFDSSKDKESSFIRGSWDFLFHIARPLAPYLTSPEDRVALEIGHGGARMLAAASRCFRQVIGVDIHDHNMKVDKALRERGICNVQLFTTEGSILPLPAETVDCVYSFIVLQHVEKYSIFKRYFEETYRVLKPGGLAILYFARKYGWSFNRSSRLLYAVDRVTESLRLRKGFEEVAAAVNGTNLRVSLSHGQRLASSIGFTVLQHLVSRRRVPDGVDLYGGQNGLVLKKSLGSPTFGRRR